MQYENVEIVAFNLGPSIPAEVPDDTFENLRASVSADRQILFGLHKLIGGF